MNEYFKILQEVNQSTIQLLAAEYHGLESIEIQDAAKSLQESVEPCLDELKQSALKLKELVNTSVKTLDHAEDVWQSKQRIAEASQSAIWEQVADLTGTHFKIKGIKKKIEKDKSEIPKIVGDSLDSLEKIIAQCKKEYFTDKKGNFVDSIGWADKDNFSKDIQNRMANFSNEVDKKLLELLNRNIYQLELNCLVDSSKIENYIILFDAKNTQYYTNRFNSLAKVIDEKFCGALNALGGIFEQRYVIQTLYNQTIPILTSWQKRLIGNISWKEVDDFEKEVKKKVENRVEMILVDRLEFAIKTIEEGLDFYNMFLELQNKYKQETPETRLIEKVWIDNQYQLLSGIQKQILKIIE